MANTNVPTAPGWPGRATTPTSRRSPVPRRRRLLVLAFMLAVIAIAVLANHGPLQTYRGAQERLEQATAAVDTLEAEKAALQSELGRLTEAGYLEGLAREALTYARPGEDVYIVTSPETSESEADLSAVASGAAADNAEGAAGGEASPEGADEPGPLEEVPLRASRPLLGSQT